MKNRIYRVLPVLLLFIVTACNGNHARDPQSDALLRAARAGHADTVKSLLNTPDVDVNVKDENGATPLIEAARNGHDDVVGVLLVARADVKVKDNQGKTALMYASEGGHSETVELLKQAGATESR